MNLDDYVPVAERLTEALSRYPELRIQAGTPAVVTVDGQAYVSVTVTVWRSPDDPLPSIATAWERYPGLTSFTRDSEMMNAETSALGRALAFMGISSRHSVATREEVQARTGSDRAPAPPPANTVATRRDSGPNTVPGGRSNDRGGAPGRLTDRQAALIRAMSSERGVDVPDELDSFTADDATAYIDRLKSVPKIR